MTLFRSGIVQLHIVVDVVNEAVAVAVVVVVVIVAPAVVLVVATIIVLVFCADSFRSTSFTRVNLSAGNQTETNTIIQISGCSQNIIKLVEVFQR